MPIEMNQMPVYAYVESISMPETIIETLFFLQNTQTINNKYENIQVILDNVNDLYESDIDEDDFTIPNNRKNLKVKLRIKNISQHIPSLIFEESEEVED